MRTPDPRGTPAVFTAMLCAGFVSAHFIAGKATRDALFLAHLGVTSLPIIVMATSATSILLVMWSSRLMRRIAPATLVPAMFLVNAAMLLVEWGLTTIAPAVAAIAVYLQISGLGPMLGSGFWLIASERFDPRTAKRRFGQIAGVGTLGGLLGGLFAERAAIVLPIAEMLPMLTLMSVICAWGIRRLAADAPSLGASSIEMPHLSTKPARSGLHVLAKAPYLRNLAGMVLLSAIGAAMVDYLFKAQAVAAFGRGETLLRFFAIYYAALSLITFVVQTSSSRFVLEKFGLAITASTPSAAMLLGSIFGLLAPGLPGMMAARGGESIFRGSLFRSGYELFYTPIPPAEKRAAKSIVDVAFDRLGDAVGGGLIRMMLFLAPATQYSAILSGALACSVIALVLASRLSRNYILTLERSLLNRAVEVEFSEITDLTTRTVMLQTLTGTRHGTAFERRETPRAPAPSSRDQPTIPAGDSELMQIATLRSRDRDRIVPLLQKDEGIAAALIPHVIPLLAWDPVAEDAMNALRRVAEERIGELTDAMIDPNQPFAVRRRLARVMSVCVSQRAVDGLVLGLDDTRFEVRFQSGRSLAAILEKNPRIRIDKNHTFRVVRQEVAVGRPVWESRQLIDRADDHDPSSFVDEFVKTRASRSLAHVFTLLSLVLPAEPLQIAFRGLHTDDQNLRGTALEYLEGVLPPDVREPLWPFLEDQRQGSRASRPREEILEDLLRSNQSIKLNLDELKRRAREA